MKIFYLHTTPPPKWVGTDALHNTIDNLSETFDSKIANLFPFANPGSWYPKALLGIHCLKKLISLAKECDVIHVYSPTPAWYPILHLMRDKPIVLSVVAGASNKRTSRNLNKYDIVILSNERDKNTLEYLNDQKTKLLRPGIDTSHISRHGPRSTSSTHLLMASAPWTRAQFHSKGVDLLLELVQREPELEITFLWREVLYQDMVRKIANLPSSVRNRVHLINKRIDINLLLEAVDGVVLLATTSDLVKAYPHSLVEGLAAGKPLLLSRAIAMSDYVESKACGLVLENFNLQNLQHKLSLFRDNYSALHTAAGQTLGKDFSPVEYTSNLRSIYTNLLS